MHQVLTYSTNNAIHEGAKKLNDTELLRKITDTDLIAQEARHDKQCYSLFVLKTKKVESVPSNSEDYEKFDAFDKLLSIVDHEIFEKRKAVPEKSPWLLWGCALSYNQLLNKNKTPHTL